MGYPVNHKGKTRDKILASARKLWKSKGYDGASVDAVMKDAGLTRGGFYAHFKSKDDLLIEALAENKVIDGIRKMKEAGIIDPEIHRRETINWYLSLEHCNDPGEGCPLTSLSQEASRMNGKPRKILSSMVKRFANWIAGDVEERNGMAIVSMMVGAVTLARAIDDDVLSEQILSEAKRGVEKLLKV